MRKKSLIIAVSLLPLVSADQALAGNAGAAFVGGLIGGAMGAGAYSAPRARRSRPATTPSKARAAAPAAVVTVTPWMAAPTASGGMTLTSGQGVSFSYDESGAPLLIVQPNAFVPPTAFNTEVPLSVVVDGHAFAVLQADVRENGLVVHDVQVIALEQQLKPAHKATFTSPFASVEVALSGFTKSADQLEMMRQQMVIMAATNPDKAKQVAAGNLPQSTTVVQVQVNGASTQPQPASDTGSQTGIVQAAAVQDLSSQTIAAGNAVNIDIGDASQVNKRIGDLQVEIGILTKVLTEQKDEQATAADEDDKLTLEQTIAAITSHLDVLEQEYDAKNTTFETYLTSVKPDDKNLYMSARKASQVFPKVPYYIPGNLDQLESIRNALVKLRKDSTVAHDNKIRKIYAKRVICFPEAQCPEEHLNGEKGKTSTEVIFLIYEDGSTAGRLQLNKGAFQDGVNFSIDSALLLQAYLAHVIKEAKLEFKSGTQTTKDLDQMFQ